MSSFVYTSNLRPLGYSARNLPLNSSLNGINSDLAFKDDLVIQGNWDGFRIIDVADPANPIQLVNYAGCAHPSGQGDVVVYGNLLIWTADAPADATNMCGGELAGLGFEGVHLFDISNPSSPQYIRKVRMASAGNESGAPSGCGAHTATAVPDPARDNLYLYVGGSSGSCMGMDIVRIKLSDPTQASYLRRANANRQCHDNNVILGTVNLALCAGGNGFSVFKFDPSLPADAAGGIANPALLYSKSMGGVGIAHSGSFSYDGKVLIFGHEPGGGSQPNCQAGSSVLNKSLFFMDPLTGNQLGVLVHPRAADRPGELHVAQLQRHPDLQGQHRGLRQLPGRHLGDRLHQSRRCRRRSRARTRHRSAPRRTSPAAIGPRTSTTACSTSRTSAAA